METQFLTDSKGNKTAVVLSMKKYNKLMEHLEDLADIRAYDEAKKNDDGVRFTFEEAFAIIEAKRKELH